MIKKTHYHDHALRAFRRFTEPIKSEADINDRIAVENTLSELKDNEGLVVSNIYMIPGIPKKGEISARVNVATSMFFMSDSTIYRILSRARKSFAIHRGLI